jgi:hypothetical protein
MRLQSPTGTRRHLDHGTKHRPWLTALLARRKNVLHVVNFFQQNGFGKKVVPGPDFKGELTNIDLTAETGLSHTTIEKSPRLHAMVMQKIVDVVQKDLATRTKACKKKRKKPKLETPS